MIFGFWKNKKPDEPCTIYATQNGSVHPIDQMPDEVFSEKTLGDGVCIEPADGRVCSPVTGRVESVADTGHALGITSEDGAEIMIHIGVDTVELNGEGFHLHTKPGDKVKRGNLICEADLRVLEAANMPACTAIILTNSDSFEITQIMTGESTAGETPIFRYRRK